MKDPPDVSRGEAQTEAEVLVESLVVALWDGTASKPGNPFTVEPPKEAIETPLCAALWSGMLSVLFSCTTGSIIMEAAAVLARNNCRLSSGEARTIKKQICIMQDSSIVKLSVINLVTVLSHIHAINFDIH